MSKLKPLGSGIIPILLSKIYALIVICRNLWYDLNPLAVKRTGRFTISVGCIHAGGTGKTPLALLIGHYYYINGYETAVLSRGYGRKSSSQIIVKPGEQKSWTEIGDEPALMKSSFPSSWLGIGADRYHNAEKIKKQLGSRAVFILDDGFQHRKIIRNKNVVCMPPDPFDDYLIPAGTLREPFSSLERADIICLIGLKTETDILDKNYEKLAKQYPAKKIFILYQQPDQWINLNTGESAEKPPMEKPVLISGIARPHRFISMVKETGITPRKCICYEDHHIFTGNEINKVYLSGGDGIITTEKDKFRFSTINFVNQLNIWYLKIKLVFFNSISEKDFFNCFLANNNNSNK